MKALLIISERDNVATALEPLEVGRTVDISGRMLLVQESIPSGHKIAIADIARDQPVVKYGSAIGLATESITCGSHVHTHNLESRRGRGDLERPAMEPAPGARLAEPLDDATEAPSVVPAGSTVRTTHD